MRTWFRGSFAACLFAGIWVSGLAQAAAPKAAVPNDALVTFNSTLLDMSFTYPGSLAAIKLGTPAEQHAEAASKRPNGGEPLLVTFDQCTDSSLVALRTDDPDKPSGLPGPALAAFLHISRVDIDCLPEELHTGLDDLAAGFAASRAQGKDLEPVGDPVAYSVGKTMVHMALAQAVAVEGRPPSHYVASIAFLSSGSLVLMNFDCTDVLFLKRMMGGTIRIGKQAPVALFPPGK